MKKVITFGVFDYFHYGHLKLFERAKSLGDYLIVAVQDGEFILKYKPETNVLYTTEQRVELIKALKIVDEVVVYKNVDQDIKNIDFDIWAKGEDQNHQGFVRAVEYAKEMGKDIRILTRTKGISSTFIRGKLSEEK